MLEIVKQFFVIFIIIVGLYSCSDKVTAEFEIINNSSLKIDWLRIEPNLKKDGKFISLDIYEEISYKIDMTNIKKSDGAYILSYKLNGEYKSKVFGYYTNG